MDVGCRRSRRVWNEGCEATIQTELQDVDRLFPIHHCRYTTTRSQAFLKGRPPSYRVVHCSPLPQVTGETTTGSVEPGLIALGRSADACAQGWSSGPAVHLNSRSGRFFHRSVHPIGRWNPVCLSSGVLNHTKSAENEALD